MVVLFQEGVVNASYPIDLGDRGRTPGDGWAVYYDNYETNSPADVTVKAVCGRTMPSYRRAGFTAGAGRAVTRRAGCPNGTFAWGGGASHRGPFNTMNLSESAPADCPTQLQHVVSGGASHSAPGRMALNSIFPLDLDGTVDDAPDDGFEVEIENYTSATHRATVYAVCLRR